MIATAAKGGGGLGRWLYILGALAFVFAAGEEIDWGQRIFGFETPGSLRDINMNDAFNLHCVFRSKPITDSGATRSPIPAQADH